MKLDMVDYCANLYKVEENVDCKIVIEQGGMKSVFKLPHMYFQPRRLLTSGFMSSIGFAHQRPPSSSDYRMSPRIPALPCVSASALRESEKFDSLITCAETGVRTRYLSVTGTPPQHARPILHGLNTLLFRNFLLVVVSLATATPRF